MPYRCKYKIRKLSILWWLTRVGGLLLSIVGVYCWLIIILQWDKL